jgi:hypothetical protein
MPGLVTAGAAAVHPAGTGPAERERLRRSSPRPPVDMTEAHHEGVPFGPVAAARALEIDGRDPRNWINEQTENNKMQRTRSGHLGGGPRR